MTWQPYREPDPGADVVPIARPLARLAERLGAASPKALTTVFDEWATTVGDDIARHAQPVSLANGILTVGVDDARWATQLRWMTKQLVDRLNSALGEQQITRIDVRFQRPNSAE